MIQKEIQNYSEVKFLDWQKMSRGCGYDVSIDGSSYSYNRARTLLLNKATYKAKHTYTICQLPPPSRSC